MVKTKPKIFLGILLFVQFLERFAYTNILVQLPIYIAQKGFENTLGWGQEVKGWIFFIWALVQNLTPVFLGLVADKISPKKAIVTSLILTSLGYFLLSLSKTLVFMLLSLILVGFGSGFFKPSMQSLLSKSQNRKIWAFYIFINNFAFLIALIASKFFRTISWEYVFLGSLAISTVNILVSSIIFAKEFEDTESVVKNEKIKLSEIFNVIRDKKLLLIISITTCFAMIYMQFYETMPNFIVDWVNTSSIVEKFSLPSYFTMQTIQGKQISYELLYTLNPLLILLFVWFLHMFTKHRNVLNTLMVAQIFVATGFALCGFTMFGTIFIFGVVVYTIGETLFNMKILEIVTQISPERKRATYFGVLNISYTIGLTSGALTGGYLYRDYAEKFTLAKKFLTERISNGIDKEPFSKISEILHIEDVTSFLWSYYKPYFFWVPFLIISGIGIVLTFVGKKYNFD